MVTIVNFLSQQIHYNIMSAEIAIFLTKCKRLQFKKILLIPKRGFSIWKRGWIQHPERFIIKIAYSFQWKLTNENYISIYIVSSRKKATKRGCAKSS